MQSKLPRKGAAMAIISWAMDYRTFRLREDINDVGGLLLYCALNFSSSNAQKHSICPTLDHILSQSQLRSSLPL
jgi:hypothetical protein